MLSILFGTIALVGACFVLAFGALDKSDSEGKGQCVEELREHHSSLGNRDTTTIDLDDLNII